MTTNKPMTGEQLDELMTVAVNMQREAETDCNRPSAMFAYAVQVAVIELRKVRNDAAELEQQLAESHRALRAETTAHENMQMQVEKLAAENAGLKAGFKFFSYSEMAGFEEHGTAELAMKSADADLAGERDEASSDGWSEETDTICWGVIVQKAFENKFEKPSEENGWIGWSDYALLPSIETPATDAFLAEVRVQGVESAGEYLKQYAQGLHEEARLVLQDAGELCNGFAAQLRKGVKS